MNQTTDEEESASELQFGDMNFRTIQCLTHDEMYVLCAARRGPSSLRSEILEQTYEFLEKVATSKNTQKLLPLSDELRNFFKDSQLRLKADPTKQAMLHVYEVSCLSNFVDDQTTVEEMVCLLPSLDRFLDEDIQMTIREIASAKEQVSNDGLM